MKWLLIFLLLLYHQFRQKSINNVVILQTVAMRELVEEMINYLKESGDGASGKILKNSNTWDSDRSTTTHTMSKDSTTYNSNERKHDGTNTLSNKLSQYYNSRSSVPDTESQRDRKSVV